MFLVLSLICMESENQVYGARFRNGYRRNNHVSKGSSNGHKRNNRESFNEADSIYDRYGNEHLVDDYGNCYDCDNQHEF